MSIRPFFDRWPQYNRRMIEIVREMTDEQLAIRPAATHWPLWATIGHTAGTRVYWLCTVAGEPGADATPWPDMATDGWEDDLDHPRSADELADALASTFMIVERVLDTWSPDMLGHEFERSYGDERQLHSRSSILQRLLTHDAYHSGELSQTLGIHGLPEIYIWRSY